MSRFVLKCVAVGGVAAGSYCTGTYLERRKTVATLERGLSIDGAILDGVLSSGDRLKSMPGLPVFGTVSAATPISGTELAAGPARVSQIMKYGFPGLDNVRSLENYVLSYDRRNRVAHWVFEHLTRDAVKPATGVDRALCDFHHDESVHPFFRSENSDYKGSGFDRGHLAAAGNHRLNQKHVDQTFLLSNMAPQVGVGFNRHKWNELEKYVRKLTNKYANVYVCTGCLYLPRREGDGKTYVRYQVIGANSVAVPTHFYKVVVGEGGSGELHLEAYCLPNEKIDDATPLINFRVPPDTIERASGLLFFDRIQRNKLLSINGKKQ